MATSFPIDHTPSIIENKQPASKSSRSRSYDSFIVRLWQDETSDSMLRVELQHVQAGLSIEALQVPLDWILPEMLGCLHSSMDGQNGEELTAGQSS